MLRNATIATLLATGAGLGATSYYHNAIAVTVKDGTEPTISYATGAGDLFTEDDIECGDDVYIKGDTVTFYTQGQTIVADTNNEIQLGDSEDISFGFGTSNYVLLTSDSGVTRIEPGAIQILNSASYKITLDAGAGLGMAGIQTDATALSSTAAEENFLYFANGNMLNEVSVTDAGGGGACTPTMDAEGLDICVGVADNDAVELWGGMYGASGRAFVAGTDAISFCTTWNIHDVSGSDAMYCGVRTASDAAQEPITGYTDYCGTGHVQGQYKVTDKTTGDTDCGADAIADDETDTWCIIVSAAGACTYTVDGVAPSTTDAHTLTAGKLFIPFCNMRSHSDVADDTWLTDWTFSKTN